MGDYITQTMRPKGTAGTNDVNRFEQTRLSAAVQADKEVDMWRKRNIYAVENTEMTDLDGFDAHDLDFHSPTSVGPLVRRCTSESHGHHDELTA